MNELPQGSSRRRLSIAAAAILLLVSLGAWSIASRVDPRFIGTWRHAERSDPVTLDDYDLRSDGTGDLITSKDERLLIDWWFDGADLCLTPGKASMAGRLIDSLQTTLRIRGPQPIFRLRIVRIDPDRIVYQMLEKNGTSPAAEYILSRQK